MKKVIISAVFAIVTLISFSSCESMEPKEYEVKILNECNEDITILGISVPFQKYRIDKVLFNGELVAENIAAPSYSGNRTESEYFTVETEVDYEMEVEYTSYLYDDETNSWEFHASESCVLGTTSWSNTDTHTKFAVKLTIGSILQLYKPQFSEFYVE